MGNTSTETQRESILDITLPTLKTGLRLNLFATVYIKFNSVLLDYISYKVCLIKFSVWKYCLGQVIWLDKISLNICAFLFIIKIGETFIKTYFVKEWDYQACVIYYSYIIQTWNSALAYLTEALSQIVEGYVEFTKLKLWKPITWRVYTKKPLLAFLHNLLHISIKIWILQK